MIRTLPCALVLLLAVVGSAAAQSDRPALRGNVTVAGDIVHIGDLVENAGPVANVAIFRAPDLGTAGAVATARIVEAIRPYQLIDIDTRGFGEVTVTRSSRAIAPHDISASIAQALSRQYGIADAHDISLHFDLPVRPLQVEAGATGDLQVPALSFDARSGRFEATLDLPSSPLLHANRPRLTGTAVESVDAVAVDRPVERGEVLQAADLTVVQRPKAQAAGLATMSAAIGMAARRALRPGQPLAAADLAKPEIVQRNDTVTLVYAAPGLTLTLRGQAQAAGALGDTIGILNAQTKRVVQGVVSGPGRVTVAAATTRLVATAPDAAQQSAASAAVEVRE